VTDLIVILTEQALEPADARRITALHEGEQLRYYVLVPADTDRNLLADVIDHLSMLELREALKAVRGHDRPKPDQARADAADELATSLASLRALGLEADGEVTEDDPLPATHQAVEQHQAREVVVVTEPHAVEDTFHRDWASRARDELGVPVLHVYAGTTFLG
jgi:hypothetical protein